MKCMYKEYDELPLMLRADEVAMVLGISKANAYLLMHSKNFPTIVIGKRMMVQRDHFICWVNQQSNVSKAL
ncbi:MAG: helix-turn-helix domain-containing protein [Faecousia sp.]